MDCSRGRRRPSSILLLCLFFLCSAAFQFQLCLSDFPQIWRKSAHQSDASRSGGSIVLPVSGNVYPLGYYSVSLNVGRPPKLFDLDIDTGSDLTWIQCDAPCTGCTKSRDSLYKPNGNLVQCEDPLCSAIQTTGNEPCTDDQCDYEIEYADNGSSIGVLVGDYYHLRLTNGSQLSPRLIFGCGYNQQHHGPISPPPTAGVLGLGNGKASIITQLHGFGMIRNVLGHCLSAKGGGFLFFGDDLVPSSRVAWVSMSSSLLEKHYSAGPAELVHNGKATGVKGLQVVFDSGSSYTYFNSRAYKAVLDQIKGDLKGKALKDATKDKSLPVCWKGAKPFKSVSEVKSYFKPFLLNFPKSVQLQIPPEAYLIITKHGNACLGILIGSEVGLGDLNIVGDISLQDKMVIYDNEKKQIGWASANCDLLPNADRYYNEGFSQPYAADFGGLAEEYAAAYASYKDL